MKTDGPKNELHVGKLTLKGDITSEDWSQAKDFDKAEKALADRAAKAAAWAEKRRKFTEMIEKIMGAVRRR